MSKTETKREKIERKLWSKEWINANATKWQEMNVGMKVKILNENTFCFDKYFEAVNAE